MHSTTTFFSFSWLVGIYHPINPCCDAAFHSIYIVFSSHYKFITDHISFILIGFFLAAPKLNRCVYDVWKKALRKEIKSIHSTKQSHVSLPRFNSFHFQLDRFEDMMYLLVKWNGLLDD